MFDGNCLSILGLQLCLTGIGRGGVIRTHDILLPKQALYRAEPRPDPFIQHSSA